MRCPQPNVGGNQIEMGIDDGLQIIPGVTKLMCSVFAEHVLIALKISPAVQLTILRVGWNSATDKLFDTVASSTVSGYHVNIVRL